jgi:hypothetical protein
MFLYVENYFATQMNVGSKVTQTRLGRVAHFMQKCGTYILVCSLLGETIFRTLLSNTKVLIDMILDNRNFNEKMSTLVRHIQSLLALNWHTQVRQTRHEENMRAYWFASYCLSISFYIFEVSSYFLTSSIV